ncbi:hypothetical protein CAEBREN_11091 [Caenorhabditis brenneri]|uniref:RING-type domain-containing protein n=1 Tax=Caenorhabditis brenneri TaxID=135651 RepID=G0P146_CAEBE|nr:hypothetical protein CAEBREN_11091 [Caenorhabditis brenneri]
MRLWLYKRIYQDYQAMKNKIKHLHENPQIHGELVKAQQDAIKAEYLKWESLVKKVHIRKASIATIKQEEGRLSTLQASRDAHLETLRELVNEELYKCEMCLQLMTNGDSSTKCPKIFGSCGHTVCSECMLQFKNGNGWRCPECRKFSSQICTNWELMRKINPAWQ